jgi:thermopsin
MLALVLLLALAIGTAAGPISAVHAQVQGETENSSHQYLKAGYYNYTAIAVQQNSIVAYATNSNVTIDTAFMTGQQLAVFNQTGDVGDSVIYQTGQKNYDALLEVPGTYYLVVYAPSAAANATQLYIVDSDVNLQNSSTTVGVTVQIQPGRIFSLPLHVETLGSTSQVSIVGASSQLVQYTLENRQDRTIAFASPEVTFTNFTVFPRVSSGYNLTLSPGLYVMGIQNESPQTAVVYVQYTIVPQYVNPFILLQSPTSTGVAAYGLYNRSGTVSAYKVDTGSIIGFADVSELSATDTGSNDGAASLQENAVLQVNNTGGDSFTYWPQNVLVFETSSNTVTFRDNVLNITGDGAELTNQSITGRGTTNGVTNQGSVQTYYGNYDSNYTYSYSLPQAWVLYMNETVVHGTGIVLQMGIRQLGGSDPGKVTWYDTIKVHDPDASSADFIVNGRQYTPAGAEQPIGSYYDAELVFGGGAGGEAAHFQLSAELALFYVNGTVRPFPSLYSFGADTAEAAYNIVVSNGNGVEVAGTGTPYYGVLTNDFNGSLTALTAAGATTVSQTGPASTDYILAAAIIAAVIIIGLALILRIRAARVPKLEAPTLVQGSNFYCGNCGSMLEPGSRYCYNCGAAQTPYDPKTESVPPGST